MSRPPFVILALPRSRTAWLSRLLSYGGQVCDHEPSVRFTGLADLGGYLKDGVGCADTMLALRWQDIVAFRPDVRIVVVKRTKAAVKASVLHQGYLTKQAEFVIDEVDKALKAARRHPGALFVPYSFLGKFGACREIFKHTLGADLDRQWYSSICDVKIEADLESMKKLVSQNRDGILSLYGSVLGG